MGQSVSPPLCQCGREMRPVQRGEAGYDFGCWTCPQRPDHPGHDSWCPPELTVTQRAYAEGFDPFELEDLCDADD
jgi:hypothetical protein